jgi:hypothetical protein
MTELMIRWLALVFAAPATSDTVQDGGLGITSSGQN